MIRMSCFSAAPGWSPGSPSAEPLLTITARESSLGAACSLHKRLSSLSGLVGRTSLSLWQVCQSERRYCITEKHTSVCHNILISRIYLCGFFLYQPSVLCMNILTKYYAFYFWQLGPTLFIRSFLRYE